MEATDYYAFVLVIPGLSTQANKGQYYNPNRYKFNEGTELNNKEFADGSGLEYYETTFRSYDPQIGRFHQVDMLAEANESFSVYAYAQDNPIYFNDPLGLAVDTAVAGVKPMQEVLVRGCSNCKPKGPNIDVAGAVAPLPVEPPLTVVPPPAKVIPFNPEPYPDVPPVPIIGTLPLALTAVGVLLPFRTGDESIRVPNPAYAPNTPDSKPDKNGDVTLYRGVDQSNPNWKYALQGMAVPLGLEGGHNDPTRHNQGDTYSIFTSWTSRPSVAVKFAGYWGIILVKRFHLSIALPSPDAFKEQEILIPGIVTGAQVTRVFLWRKL